MFVIRRIDQGGGYLARDPGNTGHIWTRDLDRVRVFYSRDLAELQRCPENERVIPLADILENGRTQ
jgi:hypothetical protein